MSIEEKDLTNALALHIKDAQEREKERLIQLKQQEVLEFVGGAEIEAYAKANLSKEQQPAFKIAIYNDLIANNFAIWDRIKETATKLSQV